MEYITNLYKRGFQNEEATSVCTAAVLLDGGGGGGAVCAHLGIVHLLTFWQAHNAACASRLFIILCCCVYCREERRLRSAVP